VRNQSTTFLLTILVVTAVVSIGWALPGVASQATSVCGPAMPSDSGDSLACFGYRAIPETGSLSSRLGAQPVSTAREDDDVASSTGRVAAEAASRAVEGKAALLTRRASTRHRTSRLQNVGAVSTVATVHQHSARQLYGLAAVNTPTLTAIADVPLNRGPTPITSISL
jgi:hypothetical protein